MQATFSFKIAPLCNYTLLPATVKVLATFLEGIMWRPFQLVHRIMSVPSQRRRPCGADFSRGNRWKLAGSRSGECGLMLHVITSFIAKQSLTITDRCAGALS